MNHFSEPLVSGWFSGPSADRKISGQVTYVLEIQMPAGEHTSRLVEIPFLNNRFNFPESDSPGRVGFEESAKIEGHTVSWHHEGILYDAGVNYVGVVSGSQMYGRVYNHVRSPEGETGFWRLYRAGE